MGTVSISVLAAADIVNFSIPTLAEPSWTIAQLASQMEGAVKLLLLGLGAFDGETKELTFSFLSRRGSRARMPI